MGQARISKKFSAWLKSFKPEEIEDMIAKVLGDAVGREYEGEIKISNFNPIFNSDIQDATEITILIKKK